MYTMEELEAKMNDICELKDKLVEAARGEMAKGIECVDTHEMGQVVDMIKDLAKVEKDCAEAHYYKTVTKAMEEVGEMREQGFYGYTPPMKKNRDKRWGRPYIDQEPYMMDYLEDGEMDWDDMPMGYTRTGRNRSMPHHGGRSNRTANRDSMGRYGKAYNSFSEARRNYHETNSQADKDEMTAAAHEHMADTMTTIREIWRSADPELKQRMKKDMTNLIGEMNM